MRAEQAKVRSWMQNKEITESTESKKLQKLKNIPEKLFFKLEWKRHSWQQTCFEDGKAIIV